MPLPVPQVLRRIGSGVVPHPVGLMASGDGAGGALQSLYRQRDVGRDELVGDGFAVAVGEDLINLGADLHDAPAAGEFNEEEAPPDATAGPAGVALFDFVEPDIIAV